MKDIIFDFGNVLVRWEPERVYREHFGSEEQAWWFLRHVCDAQWRNRIDAGESTTTCIAERQQEFPDMAEAIGLYQSRWAEMLTGEVPGMRHLLGALADTGHRLYGLTNWSMETFPAARQRFGILQMIDRYVVSGAEGMVKPDPGLFRVLLDRYGLTASDCLFVDDNAANVEAARRLGMEGIVFCNADDLCHRLHLEVEVARRVFAADRYSTELTGIAIGSIGDHTATCTLNVTGRHRNAMGVAMGGALYTLADFSAAVAANSDCYVGDGLHWVSLDATIHYLAAAKGDRLTATCTPVRIGRTTALYETRISDAQDGKLVAIVDTTMMRVKRAG